MELFFTPSTKYHELVTDDKELALAVKLQHHNTATFITVNENSSTGVLLHTVYRVTWKKEG